MIDARIVALFVASSVLCLSLAFLAGVAVWTVVKVRDATAAATKLEASNQSLAALAQSLELHAKAFIVEVKNLGTLQKGLADLQQSEILCIENLRIAVENLANVLMNREARQAMLREQMLKARAGQGLDADTFQKMEDGTRQGQEQIDTIRMLERAAKAEGL